MAANITTTPIDNIANLQTVLRQTFNMLIRYTRNICYRYRSINDIFWHHNRSTIFRIIRLM